MIVTTVIILLRHSYTWSCNLWVCYTELFCMVIRDKVQGIGIETLELE